MIQIEHLNKSYGKTRALIDVQMELNPGIYALLGPNGAGKSTLMNILTLGLRADSGHVLWNGTPIEKAGKSYRAILGFMPQQQGLYDGFRGVDFLSYIASLKCIPKKQIRDEVYRVAELVNLSDRLSDPLPISIRAGCASEYCWLQPLSATLSWSSSTSRRPDWIRRSVFIPARSSSP